MFHIVGLVFRYLPFVLEAVLAVERVVGAGKGKEKKEIVMSAFQAAARVGEKSDDRVVTAVSELVNLNVDMLNKSGIFKKSEPEK